MHLMHLIHLIRLIQLIHLISRYQLLLEYLMKYRHHLSSRHPQW